MNWWIFLLGLIAFYHQNKYFGWNALPQSDAELIADLLCFLLFAVAMVRR